MAGSLHNAGQADIEPAPRDMSGETVSRSYTNSGAALQHGGSETQSSGPKHTGGTNAQWSEPAPAHQLS